MKSGLRSRYTRIPLPGRFDTSIRRGFTRVKEVRRAGVNVAISHDSIMAPWYSLGVGDPVQTYLVMGHYGQMSGREEIASMVTVYVGYAFTSSPTSGRPRSSKRRRQ